MRAGTGTSLASWRGGRKEDKVSAPPILQQTKGIKSAVSEEFPLFQPFPAKVMFTQYQPYSSYEATVILRNMDEVRVAHH
jgi:hypothetical protein